MILTLLCGIGVTKSLSRASRTMLILTGSCFGPRRPQCCCLHQPLRLLLRSSHSTSTAMVGVLHVGPCAALMLTRALAPQKKTDASQIPRTATAVRQQQQQKEGATERTLRTKPFSTGMTLHTAIFMAGEGRKRGRRREGGATATSPRGARPILLPQRRTKKRRIASRSSPRRCAYCTQFKMRSAARRSPPCAFSKCERRIGRSSNAPAPPPRRSHSAVHLGGLEGPHRRPRRLFPPPPLPSTGCGLASV